VVAGGWDWVVSLYPESADLDEFGDEMATDVEGDKGFKATDAVAADECCRGDGVWEGKGGDLIII